MKLLGDILGAMFINCITIYIWRKLLNKKIETKSFR